MAERKEALDFDHCCIALKKLGKMHASSVILAKENPPLMDKYSFGILHGSENNPGLMQQCLTYSFPALCDVTKNWEGFEEISKKLDNMKDQFWTIAYDSASRKRDGYRVLNHGDFWINNILYKYDEIGKPIDTLFVSLLNLKYKGRIISTIVDLKSTKHCMNVPSFCFSLRIDQNHSILI